MNVSRFVPIIFIFFWVACGAPTSPGLGERAAAIVGGKADSGDAAVVLVMAHEARSSLVVLCTGEVISPHVILTAAHCVSPAALGIAQPEFAVYPGSAIDARGGVAAARAVKETHFNPSFNLGNLQGGNDVAVVVLQDPIGVPPLAMNRTPLSSDMVGRPVRLVGFGVTSSQDTASKTAGTRRQTQSQLSAVDDLLLRFDGPSNTCEGDSGGPALMQVNGQEVIIGITSFGDDKCMQSGYGTRVDAFAASYVDPLVAAVDPLSSENIPESNPATTFAIGSIGATCTTSADCNSKICAQAAAGNFCTMACDLSEGSCPSGTTCGTLIMSGKNYCLRNSTGSCSMSTHPSGGGLGSLALAAVGLALLVARAERKRPD